MAVQQSILQMVDTPPPVKGKLPGNGQSSADNMRKFEREMDKVQSDQQAPRKAGQAPSASRQSEAPAKTQVENAGQHNANADQNAQNAEPNGKVIASDQSAPAKKPAIDQTAQTNQNSQTSKSEVPAEIANLTNWHILEQVANKRDPKDKTNTTSLMDSVTPNAAGDTSAKTGPDQTTPETVAAQIKSIGSGNAQTPVSDPEGETDPQLAKQLAEAADKANPKLGSALIEGNTGKDAAIVTEGKSKPVLDAEAASTKIATEAEIASPNNAEKASKSDSQNELITSGTQSGSKTIAAEQVVNPAGEAVSQNGDAITEELDANVAGQEETPVAAKTKEPAQQPVEQDAKAQTSDVKQPTAQASDATKLTDEQIAKVDLAQTNEQPAKSTQPQATQATTDAANQNAQSQSSATQNTGEGTASVTQSKEALTAQRAATDPEQKQAANEDNPSDATKPETRADTKSDKPAPTVNDRQEQLAKLRSPKGAIFSELMAGVKADSNQMTNLDGANDLFDPAAEMDLSTSMSQDRSVRLTGFDAFAKTGNLPTSTSLANAQAIAAQISRHVRGGENRFEIRLDPAELGKIDVKLTIGSDGQARAHLFVERPETMDFLMRDQRMLERTLQQSGLQLEDKGLEFSLMDQGDQNQQWSEQQNQSDDDVRSSSSDSANNTEAGAEEPVDSALAQNYVATDGVNLVI